MRTALVTGAGGLIGSEAVAYFVEAGYDVIGIENDLRAYFFGRAASTANRCQELADRYDGSFRWIRGDIRDGDLLDGIFREKGHVLDLVVHAAAQPSHDWAASEPCTDFTINANGTLQVLEATRRRSPDATFILCSTNKVYGDRPNALPLVELTTRLDLPADHAYHEGIPASMPIDRCLHSLFGVSKAAADLLVQEYGRYFGMRTACFRGGCLTGPHHAGTELHGFLAYLMKCTVTGIPYTIYGYGAKQVRDNIHSADFVRALAAFHEHPRCAAVYNLGGGRVSNCSMLEAIRLCEEISGQALNWKLAAVPRTGDHRWWISDLREFKKDYPAWSVRYTIRDILQEIYDRNVEQWLASGRRIGCV